MNTQPPNPWDLVIGQLNKIEERFETFKDHLSERMTRLEEQFKAHVRMIGLIAALVGSATGIIASKGADLLIKAISMRPPVAEAVTPAMPHVSRVAH